ncbi:hypothetical protein [Limimaricola hongkongensis]|uniref:Uncharacterized protein n=1 Tax=Limimaricola hongkongensis DSM 17492 TaxID=1122180 RepID=A0A017H8Q4_9RHOB|nr:hypothetical protein [Limimaricola hongkongensis]EYD70518.1 hypothetical protein Lokhon_03151 [Limimaricola hongkongensis DSM 17492]
MRDLTSNIRAIAAVAPAVQSASVNGTAIDLKDAGRVAFILNTGAIVSAGDFSAKLQESDTTTSGDFADVAADLTDSDAPATLEATSTYKLGYRGFKRYVRVVLTKAGGTSIAAGAVAVLSDLAERPEV